MDWTNFWQVFAVAAIAVMIVQTSQWLVDKWKFGKGPPAKDTLDIGWTRDGRPKNVGVRGMRVGDYVIRIDCRGCMASDQVADWIGRVEHFNTWGANGKTEGYTAFVRLIKEFRGPGDWRDARLRNESIVIADGSLQCLGKGLWFLYK